MQTKMQKQNRDFIESIQFFNSLTSNQKDRISSILIEQKFQKNQKIVNQNDSASSFYIVKQGKCTVQKDNKDINQLKEGDSFGENALLSGNQTRACSVVAVEEVRCLALGRDQIQQVLGDKVELIIFKNIFKWSLEKCEGFNKLTKQQKEICIQTMSIREMKKGEVIAKKNVKKNIQLIILLEGSMQYKNDKEIMNNKGTIIGDRDINKNTDNVHEEDLLTVSDCHIGYLDKASLFKELGGDLQQLLQQNTRKTIIKQQEISEKNEQVSSLKLSNFTVLKKLGNGQFGNVYLVKDKGTKTHYALKCISKASVVDQQLEKYLENEKVVMQMCDHPNLMKFYCSFKDDYFIYFLLEFIYGMELFDAIREIGLLSTYDAQYYCAGMVLGLEYLHEHHTIYRDLKPENMMVENNGFLRLIDMGTAKVLKVKQNQIARTFTIIGTPHYMAPEVITGKGYSIMVDVWSLGIVLYEFVCGFVPFGEEAEDPYLIYDEIIKKDILTYPSYFKNAKCKHVIDQFLNKIAELRLPGGFQNVMKSSWYQGFDWGQFLEGKLKAPFLPNNKMMESSAVKKAEKAETSIIDEIKKELGSLPQYKKKKGNDDWDKDY